MAYFFVLFGACSDTKPSSSEREPSQNTQPVQTVKFKKFDIQSKCVVDRHLFQKMFVRYQNQVQTCFADDSPKTLDIKAVIKDGQVESITPQPSSCMKGIMDTWQFDATCSSDLVLHIRPVQ